MTGEELCLKVNVVCLALWTAVCDHDCDRAGIGILIAPSLQHYQASVSMMQESQLALGLQTAGMGGQTSELAREAWLHSCSLRVSAISPTRAAVHAE